MSSPSYDIISIPSPTPEAYLRGYIATRLLSLEVNPREIGTTYEAELAFTEEQWRSRLNSHEKATFLATKSSSPETEDWVGMVTILGPKVVQGIALHLGVPDRQVAEGTDVYVLVSMWVHPEHRQQGLGRRLIDAGFDWVREDGQANRKILYLSVFRFNGGARNLYGAMGFTEVEGYCSGERIWMIKSF